MCVSERTLPVILDQMLEHVNQSGSNAEEQLQAVRTMQEFLHELEHSLFFGALEEREVIQGGER